MSYIVCLFYFLSSCHSSLPVIVCRMPLFITFVHCLYTVCTKKETRRSYTGSAMTSKRSVSPIASLPSTPSSRDSSNDDDEGDVFSGTVSGTAVKTINVPSSGAVKAHSQTSPSRILLQPPSPSSGDFNRNNKSIVGSKNVTSQPHRSSIRSSKSEGDPMMRSRHSFSRVSPTTVRVPSKTVVNRTLS